MVSPIPHYATEEAMADARQLGLAFCLADWRSMFLAITDLMVRESRQAPRHVRAEYLGHTRDRERYTIVWAGQPFDALYNPQTAQIEKLTDTRPSAPVLPTKKPRPLAAAGAVQGGNVAANWKRLR